MNKKLILVASPPACGKTYVSELIANTVRHIVYLDKDDLADLIRSAFSVSGNEMDMDGEFYIKNLRPAEYSSILNIAFSALRFENLVILNAPFGKEVRDVEYMQELKSKANENGAELMLVWVAASPEVCRQRMIKRNSDRDTLKLENWDEYVKKINFNPPSELLEKNAVDRFFVFDSDNESAVAHSLEKILNIIGE